MKSKMFEKVERTDFPPRHKPLMVYDGKCGFCKYWIIKWQNFTGDKVDYQPFQKVADQFKDIELSYFKTAVRFIELDGKIYSGPDAAYVTYYLYSKPKFLHLWYVNKKWFRNLSDFGYNFVANNRSFMFDLSKLLLGKDPNNYQPKWLIYLGLIVLVLISLAYFL